MNLAFLKKLIRFILIQEHAGNITKTNVDFHMGTFLLIKQLL